MIITLIILIYLKGKYVMYINEKDFISVTKTSDGMFRTDQTDIAKILQSKDKKLSIIIFADGRYLGGINTRGSYITYYPLYESQIEYPIKAVLMDLDGTTLYSEEFWIRVIENTMQKVMRNTAFHFEDADLPFISGHSVSEHLQYCINKYCPTEKLDYAMSTYYDISRIHLNLLVNGKLEGMQISPANYLKDFLLYLLDKNIKIGLVTSGQYEKAYPEILSICNVLKLEKPENIYDSIITAGYPLRPHCIGTLGELVSKPHPWLYLETALVGLGLSLNDRKHVLGIEDSGAGICALRIAGIPAIGLKHGNIMQSGVNSLCIDMCDNLREIKEKYFLKQKIIAPEP